MSANDPSSALNRIISTAQILDLRATGHADLVPSEFQRFDNDMLAKSLVLDAVKLLDEFMAVGSVCSLTSAPQPRRHSSQRNTEEES